MVVRRCPCERGVRGAFPWVIQTAARGFCEQSAETLHEHTPRGLYSCPELEREREHWRWAQAWASEKGAAMRAMRMTDGTRRMTEARFREQYEAIRSLFCKFACILHF